MTATAASLNDNELTPLLQAIASRALDTCLRGARGLAVLGDPRAFGLLLQLSRESDANARAEVCRALAALADPRAADRLRSLLYDPETTVRDAAFTALAELQASEPLSAAEAGLNAAFEDVRRRGLEALVRYLRKTPRAKNQAGPALELLARALNDSAAGVRNEAFKSALNLEVAGGGVQTLRTILQSIHADVRREVLTEAMAQVQETWAWNLVQEFYNDPDPRLREEAFTFAVRKNKELPPLETALLAQYADVRRLAVDGLIRKHTRAAQALLVKALADADQGVRQLALAALVGDDAQESLTAALASPHADVRVTAARALARHGNRAALQPLLDLATAPEPTEKERQADWLSLAESALEGLAELADQSILVPMVLLLQSPRPSLRKLAARALAWAAVPNHLETLRQALQHADPQVKYQAGLGLAYAGDPLVAAVLFSPQASEVLDRHDQFVGSFTLGSSGADRLALFLDDADENLRTRALLLLLLLEVKAPASAPVRCLTCLSARSPRVRLTAVRALECFADRAAFLAFVVERVNDRGDEPAGKISSETVETLAELLAHGSPLARARSALLLRVVSEKEAVWEQAWGLHSDRFAAEIRALRESASKREQPPSQYTPAQLLELAFGAYVGLIREQGSEPQLARVRQMALTRLQKWAQQRPDAVQLVLLQALGDPNQAVRLQAFDQLSALGMPADTLGAAALGVGHIDVGVRGLEKMAGGGTSKEGQAVLEDALRTRTDDLAIEAAKLLAARRNLVVVAGVALAAAYEPLRRQAVDWLTAEYDKTPQARDLLRQALQSRYAQVVERAAFALAGKKDPAAFDALVQLLRNAREQGPQRQVIDTLTTLGDPRTPAAFLDRIETDQEGTALVPQLFAAAGAFRQPDTVPRLLTLATRWDNALWQAYVISGHDQVIEDREDERSDRRWEQKQFPRHDAILASVLRRCIDLKKNDLLNKILPNAYWTKGSEIDPLLAVLAVHADDNLRHQAVTAISWRLRKRSGPAESLIKGLQHRHPTTQFLAAEGLARAGRAEGLSLLLAAVDLQEDFQLRQRAIQALGELGDARARDLLLKIVNDPEHLLRPAAAEALGRVGRVSKAHEVLELLVELARGHDNVSRGALSGLRWFDHPEGWQLIRRRAADGAAGWQTHAVELLGYNDDPASRDLLLRLLTSTKDRTVFATALTSARRLWPLDSLEPDYASIQNRYLNEDQAEVLFERLQRDGDAHRLLEILPRLGADAAARIKKILLSRQPLPVAEAQVVVAGLDALAASVAAHLLGRARDAKSGPVVTSALERWWKNWQENPRIIRWYVPNVMVHEIPQLEPLPSLIWAAGQLGVGVQTLVAIANADPNSRGFQRELQRAAVAALATGKPTPATQAALEKLASGDDPDTRALATLAVARANPGQAGQLAATLLSDAVAFRRASGQPNVDLLEVARPAAERIHSQGIVVPYLAAKGDVATLAAVADNPKLAEEVRLGAIEGLAAAVSLEGEAALERVGRASSNPEDLRKAAWRGLRRSRRRRQPRQGKVGP